MRFLEGLLAAQRCGWDQAQKVLALSGTYRRDDLLAALERAVRYGAFSANAVERILAVQARPKIVLERMADEEPSQLERTARATIPRRRVPRRNINTCFLRSRTP